MSVAAAALALLAGAAAGPRGPRPAARPSIVLFLCDDLDLMLGGMDSAHQPTHIPALRARGAEIPHWFAHTPVCCPSRSEILTGKYFHNLVLTPHDRWNSDGHGHAQQCMYVNETRLSPGPTFAEHLGAAGFSVGLFGKYLNLSPRSGDDKPEPWSTGPSNDNPVAAPSGVHTYFVNPGPMAKSALDPTGEYYPAWFLLGSPQFNGTFQNGAGANGTAETMLYETDLLARHADEWLRNVTEEEPHRPFFLYMGTRTLSCVHAFLCAQEPNVVWTRPHGPCVSRSPAWAARRGDPRPAAQGGLRRCDRATCVGILESLSARPPLACCSAASDARERGGERRRTLQEPLAVHAVRCEPAGPGPTLTAFSQLRQTEMVRRTAPWMSLSGQSWRLCTTSERWTPPTYSSVVTTAFTSTTCGSELGSGAPPPLPVA